MLGGGSVFGLRETAAQFTDDERSTGNAIQAGTLDLTLDGGDSHVTILNISGVVPGDSGTQSVDVSNAGTLAGVLRISLDVTSDTEGTTGGADGSGGELDSAVELAGSFDGTAVWSYTAARDLAGTTYTLDGSFAAGAIGTLTLDWRLPHAATLDAKQDATAIGMTLVLEE